MVPTWTARTWKRCVRRTEEAYRRPCHFNQRGSELLLPGLDGRVSILDKDNQQIAILGDNNNPQQHGKNNVPPERRKPGVFVSPHGCTWDRAGNIYITEWLTDGRVIKLRRVKHRSSYNSHSLAFSVKRKQGKRNNSAWRPKRPKPKSAAISSANYPPFSQWTAEALPVRASGAVMSPPARRAAGALSAHSVLPQAVQVLLLPRLHRQERAKSRQYVAALSREIELVSRLPVMGGRPFRFVYFGGGTPSFLSAKQLTSLVDRLRANINWDHAEEVTFECEPGTLSEPKIHTLQSWASRG